MSTSDTTLHTNQKSDKIEISLDEFKSLMTARSPLKCTKCEWQAPVGGELEARIGLVVAHYQTEHGMSQEEVKSASITITVEAHRCHRCGLRHPSKDFLKSLSRADNETYICQQCGTDEAMESWSTGRVTPTTEWPLTKPGGPTKPHGFQSPVWRAQRSNRMRSPNPVPSPKELPDLRLHLLERWVEGGIFQSSLPHGLDEGSGQRLLLRNASLWWIKDEMVDLTTAAAKSVPTEVKGGEIDLPADQAFGLAVLGKPWVGQDALDEKSKISVNAITWGISTVSGISCLSLGFYRYLDFAGGLSTEDLRLAQKTGGIYEAETELIETSEGTDNPVYRLHGGFWAWLGRTDWPLDCALEDLSPISSTVPLDNQQVTSAIEDRRWFAALCVLVNHRLSEQETIYAARQTRRRSERSGVEKEAALSTVRLIRLRQARHDHGAIDGPSEKKQIDWTHRWMVGSHMAWRRCGPKGGQRKLVFIAPYVKGPSDKPLILKENVRVWVK